MTDNDCNDEAVCRKIADFFCNAAHVQTLWNHFQQSYKSLPNAKSPEELRATFQKQKYLTDEQLQSLMVWKARYRTKAKVASNPKEDVKRVTKMMVKDAEADAPPSKLFATADELAGIHIPSASTIMATWDEKWPIIDIRAWKAILRISGCKDFDRGKRTLFTPDEFDRYVRIVRCSAVKLEVSPRELDVALYIVGG